MAGDLQGTEDDATAGATREDTGGPASAALASSYAAALQQQPAHAPVPASVKEDQAAAEKLSRQERIEPELVAATTHLGEYSEFHLTRAREGE